MVHMDDREIEADGDAVIVRDGCEMFITNSRIVASGTAVTVRNGDGPHLEQPCPRRNRLLRRGRPFKDVRARLPFQGLARRDELALVQDQGGNRWR
jgi:hypothetical protein